MNEPITEEQVLSVFKHSVLTKHLGGGGSHGDDSVVSMEVDSSDKGERSKFTAQYLMLYYVLLYQDILLNNMKSIG